ncbi:farnesyl cysteine carboxyl-methyltransferase [Duganella caerulea]
MRHLTVFDYVFIAMVFVSFLIRFPREYHGKKIKAVESRTNAKEKFCLTLVFTGSVTLPLIYFVSPWLDVANHTVAPVAGWIGSAIAVAGLWLFWRSHADLGRQFSPTLEVKDAHVLVSEGVYKNIRHPMYTGVFLMGLAQLLLFGNWIAGPAFLLAFLVLYNLRIDYEEKMMLDHFGNQYADYQKRTGRLLPSWG